MRKSLLSFLGRRIMLFIGLNLDSLFQLQGNIFKVEKEQVFI